MKDFWKQLRENGPIAFLAPMDGYTDSAYRQVVKKVNPNVICVTEFYSSDGLVHSKFLADSVLPHKKYENPLIVQIFGKDPETFAKAAKIIERYDVAGIDINMGCPAKKVVKSGHGSCLIINRDTAFKIVETLNKATHLPISVKTRLGWNGAETLIDFVKGLENAGASLVTVHGRTTAQAYTGNADFTQIYELKKNIGIPIICNGDISDFDDGMSKLQNLDGFMIGRGSFGNPWCFIKGGYKPTLLEILEMMSFHAKSLLECKGERKASLDIRKHLVQYLKGFPGVSNYRKRLVTIENIEALEEILNDIKKEYKNSLNLITSEIL
ncbi:MAG: tRNA-dihydrouridine synthase family protein [Candidatus Gracilibacteria bacterium]|nr:tRNA-dihydrouridine synthase family protein [Candidatus Gracilibacteria bacterium]